MTPKQASDAMTARVTTVSPETSVREIAKLFLARRISAGSVVDATGLLMGILSEGDLKAVLEYMKKTFAR